MHIHIAEQQKEVDDCLGWSGKRPIQWLYDNVAVEHQPVGPLAHGQPGDLLPHGLGASQQRCVV